MLEKTITIGDKEVRFKTSAALPRLYRERFGRDLFIDFQEVKNKSKGGHLHSNTLEIIENLAYCMAKYADKDTSDDVVEWLEQFGTTGIYLVAKDIIVMWNEEQKTMSVPKK